MASTALTQSGPDRNYQSLFNTGMVVIWGIALANLLFHVYFVVNAPQGVL